jgi:lipoate-protein ligase B
VWVGNRKIASIGVAARHWVTYHGLALNIESSGPELAQINPCGFSARTMTSMTEVLEAAVERKAVEETLSRHLLSQLS